MDHQWKVVRAFMLILLLLNIDLSEIIVFDTYSKQPITPNSNCALLLSNASYRARQCGPDTGPGPAWAGHCKYLSKSTSNKRL